jgi:SAM-dependent methyltransferase
MGTNKGNMKKNCPVCGAANLNLFQEAEPPYRVLRCAGCGIVFVDPQPETITGVYEDEYYRPWIDSQEVSRRALWERRLRDIERLCPERGRLLDIGCGIPMFLEIARRNGWQVDGTEVSEFACRYAREKSNLPIFHGVVENANFSSETFDAATIWHVLEHVPDPLNTLRHVFGLLRPGGLLIVAVPNLDDNFMKLAYRLAKGRPQHLFSTADREVHLFHFTPRTLKGTAEAAGFTVDRVIPDRGEIGAKVIVDLPARALHRLTGLTWTSTIRMIARKPAAGGRVG